jgi:rod shape-determining protein MreC
VVVALVVVSLAMITGYFRESDGGALHNVQSTAARGLEPFQIGAERLVRPFRDAWGWFDGLRTAKSDKERLQLQLDALRGQLARSRTAVTPTTQVPGIQGYAKAPRFADFRLLKADVIADLPSYQQQIVVSAGKIDGIKRYDPVISTRDGVLLGHVSKVAAGSSRVTLISDRDSAVTVYDVETDAKGILRGRGPGVGTVTFDRVPKRDIVRISDNVVTAGRLSGDDFSSFYPRNISVGRVESVAQSDTADFKQIQVQPFADLSSIDTVVILLRKGRLPTLP